MTNDELTTHARALREDLSATLPNGVGNTIDALCERIDHLTAQLARKYAAMDDAVHWLARGDIDEADRILRAALKEGEG